MDGTNTYYTKPQHQHGTEADPSRFISIFQAILSTGTSYLLQRSYLPTPGFNPQPTTVTMLILQHGPNNRRSNNKDNGNPIVSSLPFMMMIFVMCVYWSYDYCCSSITKVHITAFVIPIKQQQQQRRHLYQYSIRPASSSTATVSTSMLSMVSIGLGPQDDKDDNNTAGSATTTIATTAPIPGVDYAIPDHNEHRLDRRSKVDAQCDEWFTQLLGNDVDIGDTTNSAAAKYCCTGPVRDQVLQQLLTVPELINDIERPTTDSEWTPYVTTHLPWNIIYPSYGLEQYGIPIPRRNAEAWRNFDVMGMITAASSTNGIIDGNIIAGCDNESILHSQYTTQQLQEELYTVGGWLNDDECEGRLIYINGQFIPELSKQSTTTTTKIQNIQTLDGLSTEVTEFIARLTDGYTDTLACPVPLQDPKYPSLTSYSKLSSPHHNIGNATTQFAINTQQGTACFAALNTIKCPNIAYVHSSSSSVDESNESHKALPILIVHASTIDGGVMNTEDSTSTGVVMHPRTVVIAEAHTNLNIVQQSVTLFTNSKISEPLTTKTTPPFVVHKDRPIFQNGYTQILIKDSANVTHTMIEETGGIAVSGIEDTNNDTVRLAESIRPALYNTVFETMDIHCAGKESSYVGTVIGANGNGRTRLASYIALLQPTAHCNIKGLTLTNGLCKSDVRTCIHHIADGCTSEQVQKQMISGRGTAAFRGRIRVEQSAQQTNSNQLSRTVLLSDKCKATAIPSLEIIADDVKCTHGATVSDLSDEEVFYLRSRGLNMIEARNLLMYAYINDMIDDIPSSIWLGSSSSSSSDNNNATMAANGGLRERIYKRLQGMTPRGVRAIQGEYQSV